MKVYTTTATYMISDEVASLLKGGNPLDKKIVFCEDKFTLQIELAIAKQLGGTFGTNVFSFNRYMHSRLPKSEKVLSPEGCVLVVKGLLLELKKQLTCFKNVYDPNLASTVYELIAQLKSAKVTPEDIKKAMTETVGNLSRKLKDIYLIFSGYEEYINSHNLTDGNNRLSGLVEFFDKDEEIKNTDVIVAGFPSLNRTLVEIFKSLEKNAKSLTFVITAGENRGVYTNEVFDFIQNEYKAEYTKAEGNELASYMLNGLYCPLKKTVDGVYSNKIHLYRAKTANEEIEHIARIIRHGVINGARYRDYAISAEDIAPYELTIKRIFADYEIPVFCDRAKDLGKHPLTRLITSYIDVVNRNFAPEDVLNFVKNPLFISNKQLTDDFENYFIKCGINRKTIKEEFTERDKNLETYENIRLKLLKVCEYLDKKSDFKGCIYGILKMIEELGVFDNLDYLNKLLDDEGNSEILSVNQQIKEKFEGVIADSIAILGDKVLPLKEVKNVILTGMTSCKISVIQKSGDSVFAGDFRAVRYQKNKNLFAIGMSDGVPSSKLDSALLCDRDIARMEKSSVLVEPKIKEVNRRARETCCMALASFSENLYISYAMTSISQESVIQSELIGYMVAIFSNKKENKLSKIYDIESYGEEFEKLGGNREKDFKIRRYLSGRNALFSFSKDVGDYREGATNDFSTPSSYYKCIKDKPDGKIAGDILTSSNADVGYYVDGVNYGEKGLPVTAIEGFFDCPYKNFLSYGVKLREREEGRMRSSDIGTLLHSIAEKFVKNVNWDASEDEVNTLAGKTFDEVIQSPKYTRYSKNQEGIYSLSLIRAEAIKFCKQIFAGCIHSGLKPKYIEVSFEKENNTAIMVDTRSGKLPVNGKADRVDVSEDASNNKMRVVDYKTGNFKGSAIDTDLYMGKNLQLYLYAEAFNEKHKYVPIGVYYFPVSTDFSKEGDDEYMRLVGKTIADFDEAQIIDDTISEENLQGTYIRTNLKKKKDGAFHYMGTLLSEDDFRTYMDYAVSVAGEGLSEINEGVIIPTPADGICEYCQYHGICGYDEETDKRTRKISSIKNINIIRAVNGEEQEDLTEDETNGDN